MDVVSINPDFIRGKLAFISPRPEESNVGFNDFLGYVTTVKKN